MALKISLSRTRESCHPSPLDPTPPLPPASFPTYLRYLVARLTVAVAPASYALTMSDRMSMMSKCRDQSLAESPAIFARLLSRRSSDSETEEEEAHGSLRNSRSPSARHPFFF